MIVVSKILTNILTLWQAVAITIWPFIIVKDQSVLLSRATLRHEKIHLAQQKELGLIIFLLLYFFEFIIHFLHKWNWNRAYYSISFEKEAYWNDYNPGYLDRRKRFAWKDYFFGLKTKV